METETRLLHLFNQELTHPLADLLALLASTVGLAALVLLPLVLILRADAEAPRRREGLALIAALALTLGLTLLLQQLVGRARPEGVRLLLAMPPPGCFPSGHAALAWCVVSLLALSPTLRAAGLLRAALPLALLISASRIYLGHHYVTDVVAGAVLGASLGAAAHGLLLAPAPSWRQRLRWLLWPQIALAVLITILAYLRLIPFTPSFAYGDKLMHFILFGAVVFWLNLWLQDRRLAIGLLRPPLAPLLAFSCALAEELAQRWSAARSFELADLAADLLGMTVCYLLSRLLLPNRRTVASAA